MAQRYNGKGVEPIKLLERIQKLKDQVPKYQKEVEKASALEQSLAELCERLMADRRRIEGMYRGFGMPLDVEDTTKPKLYQTYEMYRPQQEDTADEPENIAQESPVNARANGTAQKENITASELNALNTVESSNNVPKAKAAVATTQNTTKQTEKRTETTAPVKKVEEFPTITEESFMTVSSIVRGRCKLDDVNNIWKLIWDNQKKKKPNLKITKLAESGYKVIGATGDSILGTLKHLKLIAVNKEGEIVYTTAANTNRR
jgi:hypothetical protein